jgi:hypothetical protein
MFCIPIPRNGSIKSYICPWNAEEAARTTDGGRPLRRSWYCGYCLLPEHCLTPGQEALAFSASGFLTATGAGTGLAAS